MIALVSMFALSNRTAAADLVFEVEVPTPTYECWVVGNFNGWNNNLHKMTKVDETHYTITIPESEINQTEVTKDGAVKYKYLSGGGDWAYVEKDAEGAEISDRVYTAGNKDVVIKWALTFNPNVAAIPMDVTINAFVPVDVIDLYIVGTFNNWTIPTDSTKMTLTETTPDGKLFTVTFFTADANKLQYKFCAGPAWDYEQTSANNYAYPDVTQTSATEVVEGFKKIFDPTKVGNITITATVPAGTERVWIMGSHLGWNWANLQEGTKNGDGTFTFVATNVMSMEYRLYNWNTPEWAFPEVGEADPTKERDNRVATFPENTTIAITVFAWKQAAPNALPSLNSDKYKVYSNNHSVVVEGVNSNVEVYDISGRMIQSAALKGTFKSKQLNAGFYVLKVDGATQKVSVK